MLCDTRSSGLHLHDDVHNSNKTIKLAVEATDTVDKVKAQIFDKEGLPPEQQRLILRGLLAGKHMIGSFALSNYNIQNETVLHIDLCTEL